MNFNEELKNRIDKELEIVKKEQKKNGNKTYSQEELDAIILGKKHIVQTI